MGLKESDLPRALQLADPGDSTAFCPDDTVIAAYFGRSLRSADHQQVSQHLTGCGYCRSRVGILARLEGGRDEERVPGELLARAKQLAAERVPRRHRWPIVAAAAVALVAVGVVLNVQQNFVQGPASAYPDPQGSEARVRQTRNFDRSAMRPDILHPADGAVLSPGALEVRWTPVQGTLYYEVVVLDESGATLLNDRVQPTRWESGETQMLEPGERYYLRVTSVLADGRASGSEHAAFSIAATDDQRD